MPDDMMIPGGGDSAVPPSGPQASPMSNPTEQEGLKAQARQGVQLAIKLLEASLLPFGTQSEEGKKILSSITGLAKIAGATGSPDLNQAEVKMIAAQAGPQDAGAGAPAGGGMPMGGPGPIPM